MQLKLTDPSDPSKASVALLKHASPTQSASVKNVTSAIPNEPTPAGVAKGYWVWYAAISDSKGFYQTATYTIKRCKCECTSSIVFTQVEKDWPIQTTNQVTTN